jgi:hypothetical protein
MTCLSCRSAKLVELTAEMLMHFPGLTHSEKAGVWLFPKLLVCLDCGFSGFTVPKNELASVAKGALANESSTLEERASDVALGSGIAF